MTLIYYIFLNMIANTIFLHGVALHFHHGTTSIDNNYSYDNS